MSDVNIKEEVGWQGEGAAEYFSKFQGFRLQLEQAIDTLHEETSTLSRLTDRIPTVSGMEEENQLRHEVAISVARGRTAATKGKSILEALKKVANQLSEDKLDEGQKKRFLQAQQSGLSKKYVDAARDFFEAKREYLDRSTDRVAGMVTTMDPSKDVEEVKQEIRDRGPQVVLQMAMQRAVHSDVAALHDEAVARSREIDAIQRSAAEVKEMFEDVQLLVQQQGEMLDRITVNISTAKSSVVKGNESLRKAIQKQKNMRKCYCCLAIIAIVLILIFTPIGITA